MDVDPLGDVLGGAGRTLARLVVGMGVDVEEAEGWAGHPPSLGGAPTYTGVVTDLTERYGRRPSAATRIVAWALIVGLVAGSAGYLGWVVLFHSTPSVQSRLTYFEIPDARTAQAVINVVREDETTQATCRVQAYSADHTTVGQIDIQVFSGPTTQAVPVQLRTDRLATSVDLVGCTAPDQARPR